MNFVNLTPHAIDIRRADGNILHIESSGTVARVDEKRNALPPIDDINITTASYGDIYGLPDSEPDTVYIVSMLVLAKTTRVDVFAPGPLIRDAQGRVLGCDGLTATSPTTPYLLDTLLDYGQAMANSAGHALLPDTLNFDQHFAEEVIQWGIAMANSAGHAPIPISIVYRIK